jgi:hypothetical protein
VGCAGIPDSAARAAEQRFMLATLLARVRGEVTLSYASWDATQVRSVPPASELLQSYRMNTGDPFADYEAMREAIGVPVSAVPRGRPRLDATDAWLGRLRSGGVARFGEGVVRESFPLLARGLRAAQERTARECTAHLGRVRPRAALDPRGHETARISASALENLGSCPRRYLLKYVLRLFTPDDIELKPDRWLSPLDRGLLLHRVFERSLRTARESGAEGDAAAMDSIALEALATEIEGWIERVPPPGPSVVELETEGLRSDVRAFVRM